MKKRYLILYLSPFVLAVLNFVHIILFPKEDDLNYVNENYKYIMITFILVLILLLIIYFSRNKFNYFMKKYLFIYIVLNIVIVLGTYLFL